MDPNYTETVSEDGKTFTVTFLAPKQLLLHPEYSAMVHDEVLKRAHARGLIPIGEIFHTEESVGTPEAEQAPLVEGEDMVTRRLRMMGIGRDSGPSLFGPLQDVMKVTAEVVIGSSLDLTLEEPTQPTVPDPDKPVEEPVSLEELLRTGMPDDLSELGDL